MTFKQLIFPIIFCCGAIAFPIYKASIVCDGEEELYKLEIKGRLTGRYLINNTHTHLKFYTGKDTIEPLYSSYSDDLERDINIGDSLFKTTYNDSCTIFKTNRYIGYDSCADSKFEKYKWSKRIIYGSSECSAYEGKKIRHTLDSLRNNTP